MKIDNLSELSKLLDLCRKKGVEAITVDGIVLKMAEHLPMRTAPGSIKEESEVDLSADELLFYSVSGQAIPGSD